MARGRGSWQRAGPTPPPKAGPADSQLERVKPGKSSWKGAGPEQLGSQLRAGGALGCHKVNGRRRGVAVRGESHALPELLSPRAPERSGGPGAGGQPPSRPGVRPLALACPPDYGRRRRRRCRESACCGTHCECLTMAGTRAQGVKSSPWLDFGVPKTGLGSAELGNGTWGTKLGGRTADPGPGLREREIQSQNLEDRNGGGGGKKSGGSGEKPET